MVFPREKDLVVSWSRRYPPQRMTSHDRRALGVALVLALFQGGTANLLPTQDAGKSTLHLSGPAVLPIRQQSLSRTPSPLA